jgi:hypothetical protein
MTIGRLAAAAALAAACSGCASAFDGTTESVYVETTPVSGAMCICSNDRGQWPLTSPGTAVVKKSGSVLEIRCSKEGYREAKVYAAGQMTNAGLMGALLPYAGLISSVVDASTGAALSYPHSFSIALKPDATVDAHSGVVKTDKVSQGGTTP